MSSVPKEIWQEKHKQYILDLVEHDKVLPSDLADFTTEILEQYVQEHTDNSPVAILYNCNYGGFSYSEEFKKYLEDQGKLEEQSKEKYSPHSYNRTLFSDVKDFARKCIFGRETTAFLEYLDMHYRLDLVQRIVSLTKDLEKYEKNKSALEAVLQDGRFGNLDKPFYRSTYDTAILVERTQQVLEQELKHTESYIERSISDREGCKADFFQETSHTDDTFDKLCTFVTSDWKKDERGQFNFEEMTFFDLLLEEWMPIHPVIMEKVVELIGLKSASGRHCEMAVKWIPGNISYSISEYDGMEGVKSGTALEKLRRLRG